MASYLSVKQNSLTEFVIERSRFIGRALFCDTEEKAKEALEKIRSLHGDATHNCFAYAVGAGGVESARYSDDGEPQGTAGMPILELIQKRGLKNVLIVVTRYFGGVKLGAGGLVRAYTRSAADAADAAGATLFEEAALVKLTFDYAVKSRMDRLLDACGAKLLSTEYAGGVTMRVAVKKENADGLEEAFSTATLGAGGFEKYGKEFVAFA